ncbi:helix-turn-helix domain-containing protein [Lentzea tibetensis]|uniref:helix-turn-helix domain-containing protein n=1 Tax=Lentzea tibetensis TaxID=2591470 RepID=UPI001645CDCD|nr:helix-turn-helix domain-containing protein [Lentzea tibetensis]
MDGQELGRQLRALRAASGRTLASVALEAGLSVPYVANLENGRGNPTVNALSKLADALGTTFTIALGEEAKPQQALPASLVRLSRSTRFRRDVRSIAAATGENETELAGRLLDSLAGLSTRDLAEADWFRLLDAVLLVSLHPQ